MSRSKSTWLDPVPSRSNTVAAVVEVDRPDRRAGSSRRCRARCAPVACGRSGRRDSSRSRPRSRAHREPSTTRNGNARRRLSPGRPGPAPPAWLAADNLAVPTNHDEAEHGPLSPTKSGAPQFGAFGQHLAPSAPDEETDHLGDDDGEHHGCGQHRDERTCALQLMKLISTDWVFWARNTMSGIARMIPMMRPQRARCSWALRPAATAAEWARRDDLFCWREFATQRFVGVIGHGRIVRSGRVSAPLPRLRLRRTPTVPWMPWPSRRSPRRSTNPTTNRITSESTAVRDEPVIVLTTPKVSGPQIEENRGEHRVETVELGGGLFGDHRAVEAAAERLVPPRTSPTDPANSRKAPKSPSGSR